MSFVSPPSFKFVQTNLPKHLVFFLLISKINDPTTCVKQQQQNDRPHHSFISIQSILKFLTIMEPWKPIKATTAASTSLLLVPKKKTNKVADDRKVLKKYNIRQSNKFPNKQQQFLCRTYYHIALCHTGLVGRQAGRHTDAMQFTWGRWRSWPRFFFSFVIKTFYTEGTDDDGDKIQWH